MGNRPSRRATASRGNDTLAKRTSDVYVVPEWRACFLPASTRPIDFASRKEAARAHAVALNSLSPEGLSVDEAYHVLRQTEVHLAKRGMNMSRPCGKSEKHSCYLADMMDTVNACLAAVNMRLKQLLSGHFVLKPMDVAFKEPAKEAAVKRAAVVVRWLILRHRCVVELDLDDNICRKYREFAGLWLECLSKAQTLGGLRVRLPTARPYAAEWPLNEIWHVCWLRKLELRYVDLSGTGNVPFKEFADFMQRCTQLAELKLAYFMKQPKDPTVLFGALQASRTLKWLFMDVTCLRRQDGSLLAEYLRSGPALVDLDLTSSVEAPTIKLGSFINAVQHLEDLQEISLENFSLSLEYAFALAKAVVACQKLRVLELLDCHWLLPDAGTPWDILPDIDAPWRISPLVMVLEQSTCLEYMALNLNAFDAEEVGAFFRAVAQNGKVQEVLVELADQYSIRNIYEAARKTRTEERLKLSVVSVDEVGFQVVRDAGAASLSLRTREDSSPGAVYDCLAELPSCGHLNTLELCLKAPLSVNEATPIAELLESTTALLDLNMDFCTDKDAARIILEALAVNKSVRFLTMKKWSMTRRNAKFVSAIVQASKILLSFQFHCANNDKTSSRLVASSLAERITSNHTIFCVNIRPRSGHRRPWLVLQAVTLRNHLLIERAIQFTNQDISTENGFDLQRKRGAEALDLVASSYVGPSASADVPQLFFYSEQRRNMRNAWLRVQEMDTFMCLTGIVRQNVTCYPEPDGRPQLDRLPRDCWLHIRQYLKVSDVLDPTTSAASADLRKGNAGMLHWHARLASWISRLWRTIAGRAA